MPKQSFNIKRFDLGLNNKDSQKDLAEGFLAEATNVNVSHMGKVVTTGKFDNLASSITLTDDGNAGIQAGYGLFKFSSDIVPTGGADGGEYLAYTSPKGEVFVSTNTSFNSATPIDSATLIASGSATDAKPVYYFAEGGLRVADSDFGNTGNEQIALVRIERTNDVHPDVYSSAVTDQMKFYNGGLAAPVTSDFESLASPTDPASGVEDGAAPSTSDAEFRLKLSSSSGKNDGLWPEGIYAVGISYVYFGGQESLLHTPFDAITIADAQYFLASLSIKDDSISPFIQGMRIYVKNYNNPDDEYRMLLDVNFELGSRTSLADEYDAFIDKSGYVVTNDTNNADSDARAYAIKSPALDTYATINGFLPDEKAITFNGQEAYAYKTAVVANQRAFVGNVLYVDSEGVTKEMGDRIQYSPVNKYDTFPQSYFIDVGTNDGDKIVKIIEFQDRLFVYKENKLFIINISSGSDAGWYVEGEFENRGISHPAAVAKSDLGLVWVNEFGMFGFFDTIVKISNTIDEDLWAANITSTSCAVGFIPKKNQIMVIGDCNSTDSKGYLYDIATKSFANLNDTNTLVSKKVTNLVSYKQELVCLEFTTDDTNDTYTVKRYDTDSKSQVIDITLPETDLGEPSLDKTFYSVYMTHKNGNNLTLTGGYDGAAATTNLFDSNTLSNSNDMITTKFEISSANRIKKKSIQLRVAGTAESDFELQDMTVIFRPRGAR